MSRIFMPHATAERVTVTRKKDFTLSMSQAEVEKATQILGIALSMSSHDTVPDHITGSPFVVRFFDNDMYALERNDDKGSIPFRGSEGDELIRCLHDALAMAINEQTVGRGARPAQAVSQLPDEPFF
jgi:hypothetical protein